MGLLKDVLDTAKSVVVGHGITISEFFKPPVTIRYPDEVPDYPKGVRGIPSLKVNPETNDLNCTGCGLCARACPPQIIAVEMKEDEEGNKLKYPEFYYLDASRCMVCNLCIEACPFDALEMSDWVFLSEYDADKMVLNMHQLRDIWLNSKAVRIAGGEKI